MKTGMMLGFEESIKTITTIASEAEAAGINCLYTKKEKASFSHDDTALTSY